MSDTFSVTCDCRICQRGLRADEVCQRGDVDEMRQLIKSLLNDLEQTEDDLNYHKAIADGSWPTALDSALDIIRRVQERNETQMEKLNGELRVMRREQQRERWIA